MKDHYDTQKYGLRCALHVSVFWLLLLFLTVLRASRSVASIKKLRRKWGLKSTRQQGHTLESIAEAIQNIHEQYPTRGGEMIRKQLRVELNIRVPR